MATKRDLQREVNRLNDKYCKYKKSIWNYKNMW